MADCTPKGLGVTAVPVSGTIRRVFLPANLSECLQGRFELLPGPTTTSEQPVTDPSKKHRDRPGTSRNAPRLRNVHSRKDDIGAGAAKQERDRQLRAKFPKLHAALHRKKPPKPRSRPTRPDGNNDLPPAA